MDEIRHECIFAEGGEDCLICGKAKVDVPDRIITCDRCHDVWMIHTPPAWHLWHQMVQQTLCPDCLSEVLDADAE